MIILLAGSSSCGKNTIIKELIKTNDNLKYIHTFTSREKRVGESDGNPYFFISKEEFQNKIKSNDFYEHELIHNNFYGVEKAYCQKLLKDGNHLIKDIGVIGTFSLKEQLKDDFVETIFLYVDKKTLKKRLINRGDKLEDIKIRLKRFKFEEANISKFNFLIKNYNLNQTVMIIDKLIKLNTQDFSDFIVPLQKIDKINLNKLSNYINKLINNKTFKPLKVYFNGQNFYLKKNLEKYLAGLIVNKNITKEILFKYVKTNSLEDIKKIKEFIQNYNI